MTRGSHRETCSWPSASSLCSPPPRMYVREPCFLSRANGAWLVVDYCLRGWRLMKYRKKTPPRPPSPKPEHFFTHKEPDRTKYGPMILGSSLPDLQHSAPDSKNEALKVGTRTQTPGPRHAAGVMHHHYVPPPTLLTVLDPLLIVSDTLVKV